jgi:pimeloyl-ACP methyl ester carboxylesterase
MRLRHLQQLALLLPACHVGSPRSSATPHPAVTDGIVDIGGLSLHVHCAGEGGPVVVMEAGFGNDGTVWKSVQRIVGRSVRACVYDRAGLGYSSAPATKPHTNRQMARELHRLLHRAGLQAPYVLVGHSMGGINVRLLEAEHPEEVAGMVLVDATVDPVRSRSLVPADELSKFDEFAEKVGEGIDFATFAAGAAEMRAASHSLGAKPLVVLTRSLEDTPPWATPVQVAAMRSTWLELQGELPKLSTNAYQVIVPNTHHHIQLEAPEVVAAAIVEVVSALRGRRSLDGAALGRLAAAEERSCRPGLCFEGCNRSGCDSALSAPHDEEQRGHESRRAQGN